VSVVALLKGRERYIFVFDEDSRDCLRTAIEEQAADPTLSLSRFDAKVLCEQVRRHLQPGADQQAIHPGG
jgi:type III secretory pathway component EscV